MPLIPSQVMSLQVVGVASHHSHVVGGVVCRLDDDVVTIVHGNKDTALPTIVSISLGQSINSGHIHEQDTFICPKYHICVLNNL